MAVNKCSECEQEAIIKNSLCAKCLGAYIKKTMGWITAIVLVGFGGLLVISALVPKLELDEGIGRRTTKGGYVYCTTTTGLDDITKFLIADDNQSVNYYMQTGKCGSLQSGLKVTIMSTSGSPISKVQIANKGVKVWTYAEALQ